MRRWAGLEPRVGERVELRIVDASLANAFFQGIPAARLLARARLSDEAGPWEDRMGALLAADSPDYERVRRAVARHSRVALDEGPLPAHQATIALLAWAVACDGNEPERDSSLAEIAPLANERAACSPFVVEACAALDPRLASPGVDKRAPAFEACVRLATRAVLGPLPWERLRAIAVQLERAEIGVRLFGDPAGSIFPRGVEDTIVAGDLRMAAIDRAPLDALVAKDPRQLGPITWRTERAAGGATVHLATFLADLTRLLAHAGVLVAAVSAPEPPDDDVTESGSPSPGSWAPTDWTGPAAAGLADALERGATTFARVRTAAERGGEAALDALGAEMLRVGSHAFASAAFAEILARSARPRDVVRLVTYFAIAPDPAPAAHALGSCSATDLPRVLGAWLQAMLPQAGDEAAESATARVNACIASLKPYPQLYRAVQEILPGGEPAS